MRLRVCGGIDGCPRNASDTVIRVTPACSAMARRGTGFADSFGEEGVSSEAGVGVAFLFIGLYVKEAATGVQSVCCFHVHNRLVQFVSVLFLPNPNSLSDMSYSHPKAFTLIELLTVIAIIGILAGILIPVVGRVRESARAAACVSVLRQYGVAFNMYVAENKEIFPKGDSNNKWFDQVQPYMGIQSQATTSQGRLAHSRVGTCPSWALRLSEVDEDKRNQRHGYQYNRRLHSVSDRYPPKDGIPFSKIPNPSKTLLLWDAAGNNADVSAYPGPDGTANHPKYRHRGRMNCLMVSGAVTSVRGIYNPDETVGDDPLPSANGGVNWATPGEPFFFMSKNEL